MGYRPAGDQREIGARLVQEYKIADVEAHDELFGVPPVKVGATGARVRRCGAVHGCTVRVL